MFLDYRIYRLEERIEELERRKKDVLAEAESGDPDANAYLGVVDDKVRRLRKKLESLRAKRYYQKRFTGTGGY